ncbi:cupin domain-containing protein [Anaerotignum propionicum]|uniref:Cupin domain protein n=1 Tax=Anaerotignum propionicum DSM 1682 TaxID=991789 RepID=A0A0X1U8Y3_ANAPI|nr:cupin domain-containing protein [Anaerotignum propionicum]AMJ41374.1 cupin domain protein [Anaerotignum propionicum DSM 1682]SHE98105.1 Cupin domain-containing protein [[Clostridium] propionicum DSM 1682] [Anaerotignum propionicum DSM 1682]
MATLRNLPTDNPECFSEMITPKKNQVVSMLLSSSEHIYVTLFTFADKETVSEEEYFGDTLYYVLEGETLIKQGEKMSHLKTGDVFSVPAHTLHAIGGKGSFKVLQITVNE